MSDSRSIRSYFTSKPWAKDNHKPADLHSVLPVETKENVKETKKHGADPRLPAQTPSKQPSAVVDKHLKTPANANNGLKTATPSSAESNDSGDRFGVRWQVTPPFKLLKKLEQEKGDSDGDLDTLFDSLKRKFEDNGCPDNGFKGLEMDFSIQNNVANVTSLTRGFKRYSSTSDVTTKRSKLTRNHSSSTVSSPQKQSILDMINDISKHVSSASHSPPNIQEECHVPFPALLTPNQTSITKTTDEFDEFDDIDDQTCAAALDLAMGFDEMDDFTCSAAYDMAMNSITADLTATQHQTTLRDMTFRYTVLSVSERYYEQTGPEKNLLLSIDGKSVSANAILRDDWFHTGVAEGQIVNLIGERKSASNSWVLNNQQNYLIVDPDTLISTTHIATSFDCLRRSIIQEKVKQTANPNSSLIHGKVLHEVFQKCLTHQEFSHNFINSEIQTQLKNLIQDLYIVDESLEAAESQMQESIESLRLWASIYFDPPTMRPVQVHRDESNDTTCFGISRVLDIEEHIWSPTFGLKGNIDVSIEANVQVGRHGAQKLVMPLELKTGRSTQAVSHRAQASLYTLLMSDRYGMDIKSSLLYYSKTGDTIQIPKLHDETRGLLLRRNTIVSALREKDKLPEMIVNPHLCKRCFAVETCAVYGAASKDGEVQQENIQLLHAFVGHMTERHKEFFRHWEKLLSMEENDLLTFRKEIWTLLSETREKEGSCFSNMIVSKVLPKTSTGNKVTRFVYEFRKGTTQNSSYVGTQAGMSLLGSSICIGDPIVLSLETGEIALAVGFVVSLSASSVVVAVDRRLRGKQQPLPGFDSGTNQILSFTQYGQNEGTDQTIAEDLYRIDKDEMTNSMGFARSNIANLFALTGDTKRRRLVVDLEPPLFKTVEYLPAGFEKLGLNIDQIKVLKRVSAALDYVLILGMPGTGKTTTITILIQSLISQGKSVLLSSYTHSAVDNVLMKLKEAKVQFLRIGSEQKVHPEVRDHILDPSKVSSVAELAQLYESTPAIGATCLGVKDAIFSKRKFDVCIIDEASQLTLPVCLGPLKCADSFVLVGDLNQLPPLVRNVEARKKGLDTSLFRLLHDAHPSSVVSLRFQYRMCEDIMKLCNALVYDNQLRCGNEQVAKQSLKLAHRQEVIRIHEEGRIRCDDVSSCWLRTVMEPERRVVFLDTDSVRAEESRQGELVVNDVEALLVFQIVETLLQAGIGESDIGIASPYRSQLKIIGNHLKTRSAVELLTVDKWQGKDKDCIVLSLVRSNSGGHVGELLKDWRRLNVALTRAKKKLILIGSKTTLGETDLYKRLFEIVETNGWHVQLPHQAHKQHQIYPSVSCNNAQNTFKRSPLPPKLRHPHIANDIINDAR